jgi:hypothetical protein
MTNNELQDITLKITNRATRTPLKTKDRVTRNPLKTKDQATHGLHVILRISVSDYPFSIFKLFLKNDIIENIIKDIFNLNGIDMFGSSLHPVLCRMALVLFTLYVFVYI